MYKISYFKNYDKVSKTNILNNNTYSNQTFRAYIKCFKKEHHIEMNILFDTKIDITKTIRQAILEFIGV